MTGIIQDIRYALRQLRKNPGFTATAVLTLALGIGANTAIFSLIRAVMLRSLPVHDPQRLVVLRWSARHDPKTTNYYNWAGCPQSRTYTADSPEGCSLSYPLFQQFRSGPNLFSSVAAFVFSNRVATRTGHGLAHTNDQFVSGSFFPTMGVHPALGRAIEPDDDSLSAPAAVVLSNKYWREQLGADPAVLGKSITVNDVPVTITGVMSADFTGLDTGIDVDMWMPLAWAPRVDPKFAAMFDPHVAWLWLVARLKPNVTPSQTESAANLLFVRDMTEGADALFKPEDAPRVELVSLQHGLHTLRQDYATSLFALMAGVGIVLLIAIANVAGLLLTHSAARQKEVAIRSSLGARRSRLIRQFLTESTLLALTGGALGIWLAYLSVKPLLAFLSANDAPLDLDIRPDPILLGFTCALSILAGIIFGMVPAIRASRLNVVSGMKEAGVSAPTRWKKHFGMGRLLVVGQVALSILLLASAGLLVRTVIHLETMNPGFDKQNMLLFSVDTSFSGYNDKQVAGLYAELQRRFEAVPGVLSSSYSEFGLVSGWAMSRHIKAEGQVRQDIVTNVLGVGPHFLETMHMPIIAGRTLDARDIQAAQSGTVPKSAVVNEEFVRHYADGKDVLGRVFSSGPGAFQVVGVVQNAKYSDLRKSIEPTVYLPATSGGRIFELRTAIDPMALVPSIRSIVRQLDNSLLMADVQTETEQIDKTIYQDRLRAMLSSLFALLALVLACIGLFGLLSYDVTRRTREIGVRMALGADRRSVQRVLVAHGLLLTVAGAAVGFTAAIGLTRFLKSFLYGVSPIDGISLASVAAILIAVAFFASYWPARRAAKVDPMVALRYE